MRNFYLHFGLDFVSETFIWLIKKLIDKKLHIYIFDVFLYLKKKRYFFFATKFYLRNQTK